MIKIQEPSRPWEILHMDWVTSQPPGGYRSYNSCPVIVDSLIKNQIFLPCHKNDKAMDTALLIFNREPNYPSPAYHSQTDGLAGRIIQTLEYMARRICEYGLELKYCNGFINDFSTLLPELELAYKRSVHASTNQNSAILEKGWNPRILQDYLRKDLVEIHPTSSSFKRMLEKGRKNEVIFMEE
ncbi:hypothetical protein O181_056450 [Austropuccinia psidii MF-1]|uniref:Uncharacterized protein n=1 Tax=Austropuccinia psidii MF-1 TaxID=1389203 RepID=A0A9Q3E657_9BASI|nr:hypothetical protein [Austropuccinia psidii MF-1]